MVDHSVCIQSDWWGSSVKTTMVCAGGEKKSACHVRKNHTAPFFDLKKKTFYFALMSAIIFQGDSGGPLNCKGTDGKWYVQGVTSFVDGRGCNTPQKPTVFTRVATFIPWISEVRRTTRTAIIPLQEKSNVKTFLCSVQTMAQN